MAQLRIPILLLALMVAAGCGKRERRATAAPPPDGARPPAPTDAAPAPPADAATERPIDAAVPPPDAATPAHAVLDTCQGDGDCQIACVQRGRCCNTECQCTRAMTTARATAIQQANRVQCAATRNCPFKSCPTPKLTYRARCVAHRCEAVQEPRP